MPQPFYELDVKANTPKALKRPIRNELKELGLDYRYDEEWKAADALSSRWVRLSENAQKYIEVVESEDANISF